MTGFQKLRALRFYNVEKAPVVLDSLIKRKETANSEN
jgi:hypothetical protein